MGKIQQHRFTRAHKIPRGKLLLQFVQAQGRFIYGVRCIKKRLFVRRVGIQHVCRRQNVGGAVPFSGELRVVNAQARQK